MTHEIEVVYLKNKNYSHRKFAKVDKEKARAMFEATVAKLQKDKVQALINHRREDAEGNVYLVNSYRL